MVLLECAPIADKLGALLTVHVWRGMSHHTAKHVFVTHTDGQLLNDYEQTIVSKLALYCGGVLRRHEAVEQLAKLDDPACAYLIRDTSLFNDVAKRCGEISRMRI